MLKFWNLNEQVIKNKTRFSIHDRRFFSPKRTKTQLINKISTKRSFHSLSRDKKSIVSQNSLDIKGASKSVTSERLYHSAGMKKAFSKEETKMKKEEPKRIIEATRTSKSLSKIEVINEFVKDIRVRFGLYKSKNQSQNYVKEESSLQTKKSKKPQFYNSRLRQRKKQGKYKLLQMQGKRIQTKQNERSNPISRRSKNRTDNSLQGSFRRYHQQI